MQLPIDRSLGSWTLTQNLQMVAKNPTAMDIMKMWNFLCKNPLILKDVKDRVQSILKKHGISIMPSMRIMR